MYKIGDRFFANCFRGTYFTLQTQMGQVWEVVWDTDSGTDRNGVVYGSELEELEYFQNKLIFVKDDKHFLELLLKYA